VILGLLMPSVRALVASVNSDDRGRRDSRRLYGVKLCLRHAGFGEIGEILCLLTRLCHGLYNDILGMAEKILAACYRTVLLSLPFEDGLLHSLMNDDVVISVCVS